MPTKFNSEDLRDHVSVVGIFKNKDGRILHMYHVKLKRWMPPVGKVQKGESPSEAFDREMFEELGVRVNRKYFLYQSEPYSFIRNGKEIKISFIVYSVASYSGTIINAEPHKCKGLKYLSIDNLELMAKNNPAIECVLKGLEIEKEGMI